MLNKNELRKTQYAAKLFMAPTYTIISICKHCAPIDACGLNQVGDQKLTYSSRSMSCIQGNK